MKRIVLFALLVTLTPTSLALAADANPMEGTYYQAAAAVLVFVILFIVLQKAAWKPILKGLLDREHKIKLDLEHAERAAREANQTLEQYRKQLAEAQNEAARIIDQGRADAQKLAAQLKEQAQAEINTMKQRAQSEIGIAKQQALTEIYAQTAALATDVAGRILKRQMSGDDQQQLVDQALNELSQAKLN